MRLTTRLIKATRNMVWVMALVVSVVTLSAHLIEVEGPPVPSRLREAFDPDLAGVGSVDAAVAIIRRNSPSDSPQDIAKTADRFVRERFFHGYSRFRPSQNWNAWLLGRFWWHLSAPVLPEDILRFREAACSQQAIVFMAIMRRLGFDTRAVGVTEHYLAAVKMPDGWQVFDANQEMPVTSYPLSALIAGDERILNMYPVLSKTLPDDVANGRIDVRPVNIDPAPRAGLLHRVTAWSSDWAWAALIVLALVLSWAAAKLANRERNMSADRIPGKQATGFVSPELPPIGA